MKGIKRVKKDHLLGGRTPEPVQLPPEEEQCAYAANAPTSAHLLRETVEPQSPPHHQASTPD